MTEATYKLKAPGDLDVLDELERIFPGRRDLGAGDQPPPADPYATEFASFRPEEISSTVGADGTQTTIGSTEMRDPTTGELAGTLHVERTIVPGGDVVFRREEHYADGTSTTLSTGYDLSQNQWSSEDMTLADGTRITVTATIPHDTGVTTATQTIYDAAGHPASVTTFELRPEEGFHLVFPPPAVPETGF